MDAELIPEPKCTVDTLIIPHLRNKSIRKFFVLKLLKKHLGQCRGKEKWRPMDLLQKEKECSETYHHRRLVIIVIPNVANIWT